MYIVEFYQHGLPHGHVLLFINQKKKEKIQESNGNDIDLINACKKHLRKNLNQTTTIQLCNIGVYDT